MYVYINIVARTKCTESILLCMKDFFFVSTIIISLKISSEIQNGNKAISAVFIAQKILSQVC
jgi:hypothetical protein